MIRKLLSAAAVAGVGLFGGLALPSPAQATYDGPITVGTGDCTTVEFGWTASAKAGTTLVVAVDGTVQTAPAGTAIVLDPPTSPTTVLWRVFGGGERDFDSPLWTVHPAVSTNTNTEMKAAINAYIAEHGDAWVTGGPDGAPEFLTWNEIEVPGCVTPEPPTVTPADCDSLAELVVPVVEGVVYSHESGPLNPGVHVVTASPDGYGWTFPPDATTEWEFEVVAEPGCPGADGKDGEPGQDGADGQDGQAFVPAGNDTDEGLPVTGAGTTALVATALLLGAFGAGMYLIARRRRVRFVTE